MDAMMPQRAAGRWVGFNCRFAQEQSRREMFRHPDYKMNSWFTPRQTSWKDNLPLESFDNLRVVDESRLQVRQEAALENQGGDLDPRAVGVQDVIEGTITLAGRLYLPDEYVAKEDRSSAEELVVADLTSGEWIPQELEHMFFKGGQKGVRRPEHMEMSWRVLSSTRNGDWYNMVIEGKLDVVTAVYQKTWGGSQDDYGPDRDY